MKEKPNKQAKNAPVETNLATTIPTEGTVYAGTYLQWPVTYRVDTVGRKIIVGPAELVGVVIP